MSKNRHYGKERLFLVINVNDTISKECLSCIDTTEGFILFQTITSSFRRILDTKNMLSVPIRPSRYS